MSVASMNIIRSEIYCLSALHSIGIQIYYNAALPPLREMNEWSNLFMD